MFNAKFKATLLTTMLLATGCVSATSAPVTNPVIKQVKSTVEKAKLVANPQCADYLFTKSAEPGVDLVDVMEKHGGVCPGDPQVHHRLFSVYVDQKTKQMASDKDDLENGTLTVLQPAK